MKSRNRAVAVVVLVLAVLPLPLWALPAPLQGTQDTSGGEGIVHVLSGLWQTLTSPLTALWGEEEGDGRGSLDPDGSPAAGTPNDDGDGRGVLDPDG